MTEAFKIRGEVLTDPRVVSIIVGSGPLIEIAARSFQQRQRGAFKVSVFSDLDEALAYARERIASGES